MGIHYESLDNSVRTKMVQELEQDQKNNNLYRSRRLTESGKKAWPKLLREAAEQHNDTWLASTLRKQRFMRTHEERHKPKGGSTMAKVPQTAPDTLAEGEFNRFYIRGLCAQVLESGGTEVEVYRGKTVNNPRPESSAMIGKRLPAKKLLNDLRTSPGVEPALGLPPGPNSGLSVRRV